MNAPANLPAAVPTRRPTEIRVVEDAIPMLDTARFEHMQRVASVMAKCSLIPEGLKGGDDFSTAANCFLVVNQAVRWNMDPFAVAQCVSVVKGKILHEGKLIAAVIEEKLGIALKKEWAGEGERMSITISGTFADGRTEIVEGNVADWKTTGTNSPWIPKQYKKMLWYRGAREWCRLHAPGLILGIYTPDEMDDLEDDARGRRSVASIEPPEPPPSLPHPEPQTIEETRPEPRSDDPTPPAEAQTPEPPAQIATAETRAETVDPETGEITWEDDRQAPTADAEPPTPAEPKPPIDTTEDPKSGVPAFLDRKKGATAKPEVKPAKKQAQLKEQAAWLDDCRRGAEEADSVVALGIERNRIVDPWRDRVSPQNLATAEMIFEARLEALSRDDSLDPVQWLRDLDGALSGCEAAEQLGDVKTKVLLPAKDKVPEAAWKDGVGRYRAKLNSFMTNLDAG